VSDFLPESTKPFDRYWRVRVRLPERYGQRLRVIARGTMNSAWIEFDDGVQHIVSRNAFRKLPPLAGDPV
jgi:hypothetical protein